VTDPIATESLVVRTATAGDAPVIALFNRLLAHESEGLELDAATVAAGVAAVLDDPVKGVYFVAEIAGKPVGQLMLTVEWSDWRNGPIYWIQSVYVVAERRGSGVFRALWERGLEAARQAGARAVRLYVEEGNAAAQEAYRRVGMHRSGYLVYEKEPV
jgi:GNAT superfamily N-acetyltransferase